MEFISIKTQFAIIKANERLHMNNIIFLGLISFFTDISTEMIYPVIPLYLVSSFGATPALVGVIEGIAESLAGLLKVFSGYITDRTQKKKFVAFSGYATGLLYKIILLFASSWFGILIARSIDRFGKGIRTAPRDVLISESVNKKDIGKAFGLHKALDMLGSSIGILATYFILLYWNNHNYKQLFLISVIPAILGLLMFSFIKQKKTSSEPKKREPLLKNIKKIDRRLKLYLLVVFVFTLGNSSNTFILIKAQSAGFDDIGAILLYFIYNIVASALSLPFGRLSDKIGRKNLLVPGYLVFALCYTGFAFAKTESAIIAVFVIYGVYTALITGVERAFIAEISPTDLKGTMLGLHSSVTGIALLPASVTAGLLWNALGSEAPFLFGAGLSMIAALILIIFLKNSKDQVSNHNRRDKSSAC
ncbi:MAG: MFS transporter [Eubacterium sp.]|jgi:MFS family permease|nr:MFS transporter [Eubacterium sp.]